MTRIATLLLTIGVGLVAACDYAFPPPGDGAPTINVYEDRYEFRLSRYQSLRALGIALEASPEVPTAVAVHDCEAQARLAPVLDLLRDRGILGLDVSLPENCGSGIDIGELGADYMACATPRPEVCTREFRPVCAQRDAAARCAAPPCDAIEPVTMGNACTACSDPEVYGYYPGRCDAPQD